MFVNDDEFWWMSADFFYKNAILVYRFTTRLSANAQTLLSLTFLEETLTSSRNPIFLVTFLIIKSITILNFSGDRKQHSSSQRCRGYSTSSPRRRLGSKDFHRREDWMHTMACHDGFVERSFGSVRDSVGWSCTPQSMCTHCLLGLRSSCRNCILPHGERLSCYHRCTGWSLFCSG